MRMIVWPLGKEQDAVAKNLFRIIALSFNEK